MYPSLSIFTVFFLKKLMKSIVEMIYEF
jgi:hypothetical protein